MAQAKKLPVCVWALRLEVAHEYPSGPMWRLVDWVHETGTEVSETMRILSKFNRIVASLVRQESTKRVVARYDPYSTALGVRCKVGLHVLGWHVREANELLLKAATHTQVIEEELFYRSVMARMGMVDPTMG